MSSWFFFRIALAVWGHLQFCMNFSIRLLIAARKLAGSLLGDWVESIDPFGKCCHPNHVESLVTLSRWSCPTQTAARLRG